jgi:hypothetical protein
MSAESFSRGARDNGLRCAGYRPVADLDPRIADAMLVTLRAAGIAAYAAPTPAAAGGYGELRLPSLPTDRLWVDGEQFDRAREMIGRETTSVEPDVAGPQNASLPGPGRPAAAPDVAGPDPMSSAGRTPNVDFDTAWQQVLTSLRSPSVREPDPRWPAAEGAAPGDREPDLDRLHDDLGALDVADHAEPVDPADQEHFVPPAPPPLPRLRSVTLAAVVAMALGLFVLIVDLDGGTFRVPAFAALVGGAISLVWNMRQGPPTDSGWDDGAVV